MEINVSDMAFVFCFITVTPEMSLEPDLSDKASTTRRKCPL